MYLPEASCIIRVLRYCIAVLYYTVSNLLCQAAFCSQHRIKLGSAMRTKLNRLVLAPAPIRTMLNRLGSSCGPAELCFKRVELSLLYLFKT